MHENGTSIAILWCLLAFYVEGTVAINTVPRWVRRPRYSGGNLVLNDRPQSGSPVTRTHNLNRQKFNTFTQENQQISQSHSKKFKHYFGYSQ
jgi:hypothetical protein